MYNTQSFNVGDTVWYYNGQEPKLSGTVHDVYPADHVFFNEEHYIIMVSTHVGDYLIIRPKMLVFATKET